MREDHYIDKDRLRRFRLFPQFIVRRIDQMFHCKSFIPKQFIDQRQIGRAALRRSRIADRNGQDSVTLFQIYRKFFRTADHSGRCFCNRFEFTVVFRIFLIGQRFKRGSFPDLKFLFQLEHPAGGIVHTLFGEIAGTDRAKDRLEILDRIGKQKHISSRAKEFHRAIFGSAAARQTAHGSRIGNDQSIESKLFPQQIDKQFRFDRCRKSLEFGTAAPCRECNVARHHSFHSGGDCGFPDFAESFHPCIDIKRIDRGAVMLIPVVKSCPGEMFSRCRDPGIPKPGKMSKCHVFHQFRIISESPDIHFRTRRIPVDIQHRMKKPVHADGTCLASDHICTASHFLRIACCRGCHLSRKNPVIHPPVIFHIRGKNQRNKLFITQRDKAFPAVGVVIANKETAKMTFPDHSPEFILRITSVRRHQSLSDRILQRDRIRKFSAFFHLFFLT